MIVKKGKHKRREFKGVGFLVGATGERMMVTFTSSQGRMKSLRRSF
jgi:hypothetical protein